MHSSNHCGINWCEFVENTPYRNIHLHALILKKFETTNAKNCFSCAAFGRNFTALCFPSGFLLAKSHYKNPLYCLIT